MAARSGGGGGKEAPPKPLGPPRAQDWNCEVLADWDPKAVARRMRARRADRQMIDQWARAVKPADQYRWERKKEMDYRDEVQP